MMEVNSNILTFQKNDAGNSYCAPQTVQIKDLDKIKWTDKPTKVDEWSLEENALTKQPFNVAGSCETW